MKIYQLLPTLAFGDAVSNDALALEKVIQKMGYKTEIFAESIDARLPKGSAKFVEKLPRLNEKDIILYHLSTGTKLNYRLAQMHCRKVMVYPNITPPQFFEEYSVKAAQLCQNGLEGASYLADKVDYCLAVSEYNKQDLIRMGYTCPIDVLPILIPFDDYAKTPSQQVIDRYSDGYTNLIFTGRIAPNKRQEDVIRAFYDYKKFYNPKSRLILVGGHNGMERYYHRLKSYINALELEDVVFPGHIKFDEILAYYKIADVFLCQSEHEGFCVPLVEAMYFDVPVVAYDSSAIAGTLGGGGFLLKDKNPVETAGVINRVVTDEALRTQIIKNQQARLADFDHKVIEAQFKTYLDTFINGGRKG